MELKLSYFLGFSDARAFLLLHLIIPNLQVSYQLLTLKRWVIIQRTDEKNIYHVLKVQFYVADEIFEVLHQMMKKILFCLNAESFELSLSNEIITWFLRLNVLIFMKMSQLGNICPVDGCRNYHSRPRDFATDENIRFHKFPKEEEQ